MKTDINNVTYIIMNRRGCLLKQIKSQYVLLAAIYITWVLTDLISKIVYLFYQENIKINNCLVYDIIVTHNNVNYIVRFIIIYLITKYLIRISVKRNRNLFSLKTRNCILYCAICIIYTVFVCYLGVKNTNFSYQDIIRAMIENFVFVATIEEIIFRVILFYAYKEDSIMHKVLKSAVFFTILHIEGTILIWGVSFKSLIALVIIFVLGILCGCIYKEESIIPSILMHGTYNIIVIYMLPKYVYLFLFSFILSLIIVKIGGTNETKNIYHDYCFRNDV